MDVNEVISSQNHIPFIEHQKTEFFDEMVFFYTI